MRMTRHAAWLPLVMAVGAAGYFSFGATAAENASNPVFTAAQADAGKAIYEKQCIGCHGDNLDNGEAPPLFVIGTQGDGQLVNYRFRSPYYIVDRLFGAAELRLGADKGDVVRIERTDGIAGRN